MKSKQENGERSLDGNKNFPLVNPTAKSFDDAADFRGFAL